MSGRFDYVKYDDESVAKQQEAKGLFEDIESVIGNMLDGSRAKALVMTKLEEAYMWVGKAVRDEQVKRNSQPEHVPEKGNV